jgi:Fe-S oxidoreductase
MTGQLSEEDFASERLKEILDMCINCKACSVQCPSGVDISKLVLEARAEYARRKGLSRTAIALSRNRLLSMLGSIFWPMSNFVMALGPFKWFLEKTAGFDRGRTLPRFEFGQFLTKGRKYLRRAGPIKNPVDKVVYFVDTFANFNDHALGFAVLKVLRHNNIEVILPPQRPVPLPAMAYGDAKTARKDLEYNIAHLAGPVREGYKIVCSEPSAALCLKQEMRHYVSGEDAELISKNTFELSNYLLGLQEQNKLKPVTRQIPEEFIYHLPCHLCALDEGVASVKLLQEHCGVKVTELKSGCCGLAGTFGMQKKNYELSFQIAANFKEALEKYPVRNVLTECAACKMQIEHISNRAVQHPIKVLAEAYSLTQG